MEITINGCSTCPFSTYTNCDEPICNLHNFNGKVFWASEEPYGSITREDMPEKCPIKEGITIKIKN